MAVDKWLQSVIPLHNQLSKRVAAMLEGMIRDATIDSLSVTHRTKPMADVKKKIERKGYRNPQAELTDISGIRVITFFESQVDQVSDLVEKNFRVDAENSLDKSTLLGIDRLGYRSVHYVCDLGDERAALTEYKPFQGLKFEIQIRTVLQHGWAELAHDRAYKFSGVLPSNIQRRLNLYAGMLEIADAGFDELAKQIDLYQIELESQSRETLLKSEINSLTLSKFLHDVSYRFTCGLPNIDENPVSEVVGELRSFGARTLSDVDELFSSEFVLSLNKHSQENNFMGILRDAMMFANLELYFEHAWNEDLWTGTNEATVSMLEEKYSLDKIQDVFTAYNIYVEP